MLLRVLMQGAWEMVEFVKDSLCKRVPSYIPPHPYPQASWQLESGVKQIPWLTGEPA